MKNKKIKAYEKTLKKYAKKIGKKKSDIFVANIRKNVFELMNESNQLIDLHGHERQDYLVHVFALMIEEYEEINTFEYHC